MGQRSIVTGRKRIVAALATVLLLCAGCGSSADLDGPTETGSQSSTPESGAAADTDEPTSSSEGAPESGGSASTESEGAIDADGSDPRVGPDGQWIPIDAGEQAELAPFEPEAQPVPPPTWLLYSAQAHVNVGGRSQSFGGSNSNCETIASLDTVVFNASFQENETRPLGPHFSYTDRGDGFSMWGLYLGEGGEQGEEWSGKPGGNAEISGGPGVFGVSPSGGVMFDPLTIEGVAYYLRVKWNGDANENFTSETERASIEIYCSFLAAESIEAILARRN